MPPTAAFIAHFTSKELSGQLPLEKDIPSCVMWESEMSSGSIFEVQARNILCDLRPLPEYAIKNGE